MSDSSGGEDPRERLETLLRSTLPMDEVVYAFGYGSGVFSQQIDKEREDRETKVVDLIVVVKDDLAFHRANVALNPSHYWVVPGVSDTASWCTWWQRHRPPRWLGRNPGLYFLLTDTLKYGVVQVDDLRDDLRDWKYLYLAGRMHKPVLTLIDDSQEDTTTTHRGALSNGADQFSISHLQQSINLPAALASALLLLSDDARSQRRRGHASSGEIYQQIAKLSYRGDFRVHYGAEDPQKILRLVEGPGQLQRFERLYAPAAAALRRQGVLSVEEEDNDVVSGGTGGNNETFRQPTWSWDTSPASLALLQEQLPSTVRDTMPGHPLSTRLAGIVAPSARYQSFKGIVTAGPQRAWTYVARKLSKGLLRR